MSDPSLYQYPSPLAGYENAPPLPDERAGDGKSYVNPPNNKLSKAYEEFAEPLDNGRRGGFDVHIYYFQRNEEQSKYARELWERIRREFPELRIYTFWDKPIGPHPVAMFEVNLFTPAQFGAFISWLTIWRGPLSVLIHPNTTEEGVAGDIEKRNHSQRAIWMGERIPLDFGLFKKMR
ncbi:DOPA-like domain-containing protein [Xylariales sp. AK1849]|nr:DOPA-like domain-containing protein [Xylariales sp. AK1849]